MKHLSALSLALFLCCNSQVLAQKNTVAAGLLYLPMSSQTVSSGSATYFRTLEGRKALGLKVMYSQSLRENGIDTRACNLDLLHRWSYRHKYNRSILRVDAGISVSRYVEKYPYENIGWCGTGVSDQELKERAEFAKNGWKKKYFRAGLATAFSWEFALSRHLGIGIGATFNAYPGTESEDGWYFLPIPHLNAACAF